MSLFAVSLHHLSVINQCNQIQITLKSNYLDKTSELRDELGSLLKGIRAFPEVVEEDREKIEKYAEKLIKSFEKSKTMNHEFYFY